MALARLALALLALGAGVPSRPPDHTGYVVRYGPGAPGKPDVMSRVAARRGIPWQPHMAAYTYATDADMGRLWLHIKGPAGEATFLVVDLPRPGKDKQALERCGVVAEVDYQSGALVCGKHWSGRARDCKVRIWVLR